MPGFDKKKDSIILKTLLKEGELTAGYLIMKIRTQDDTITGDEISHRLIWLVENGLVAEHRLDSRHGGKVNYMVSEAKKEEVLKLIE
jgi:DNA-binding transcriptional ArsR family regulator